MAKKEQEKATTTGNIGALAIKIKTELKSKDALALFYGRRGEKNKVVGIIGVQAFASKVRQITNASRNDDPYADLMLIRIEKALSDCEQKLKAYQENIDKKTETITGNASQTIKTINNQPIVIETSYASVYANISLQVLSHADTLFVSIYALNHIAGILNKEKAKLINEIKTLIRKTLLSVAGYHYMGINRNDIILQTARTVQVAEKMKSLGELPKEVIDGIIRAKYAPHIIKSGGALESVEGEGDNDDDE